MTEIAEKTYYRSSLGLKQEIAGLLADDYHSGLIENLRASGGTLELPGLTFHLAREFGFCYGVDKAIDMAYEARRKFPDKRIFLLTEIIHNPRVNQRILDMGIIFLSGQYKNAELSVDDIRKEDVVLVPAFGVAVEQFKRLRELGAIVVDTTCGSVVHVWKRVEKYARDGFTSLVHGKYYHEETIATVSQATAQGGQFLVVRNMDETKRVIDFIDGRISGEELIKPFHEQARSEGFDPATHLRRIGVANQTTMLASESLEIARLIGDAIERRDGAPGRDTHFRSFDTICSATQDRQDAMQEMVKANKLDLVLVVGGYNSSNTGHLLEVAMQAGHAYHIHDAGEILSATEIRHQLLRAKEPIVSSNWLPEGPIHIGLTAGASTPNKALADTIARICELRGVESGSLGRSDT